MHAYAYIFVFASALVLAAGNLQTAYEWSYVDFLWPNASYRDAMIESGRYNPRNILPMDVDVDKAGRVFVSLLGTQNTPATLGIVSQYGGPGGPLIAPYPNWNWFRPGDCNAIQNVYRIAIDSCNRLWVLDTGFLEGGLINCPPQLVIFDLNTDSWVHSIKIPEEVARGTNRRSLPATPIVDTEGPYCEKTSVYIADAFGNGLIVISNNRVRRLEYEEFGPNSNAYTISSGGLTTEFDGGILGMSVSPQLFRNEQKILFFRPLSSYDLFEASIDNIEQSFFGYRLNIKKEKGSLPSQSVAMAFSSQGTLFFGVTSENALGCWNRYRPMNKQTIGIVAQDFNRLQYLNGVKVIKSSPAHPVEQLWVMQNRFIHFQMGRLDPNGINFRILKGDVPELVSGTVCDLPDNVKSLLAPPKKISSKIIKYVLYFNIKIDNCII